MAVKKRVVASSSEEATSPMMQTLKSPVATPVVKEVFQPKKARYSSPEEQQTSVQVKQRSQPPTDNAPFVIQLGVGNINYVLNVL